MTSFLGGLIFHFMGPQIFQDMGHLGSTWRIIPLSKWLVKGVTSAIYK